MWEPVAFCCFTRRAGCLVLASLSLIGSITGFIFGMAILLAANTADILEEICRQALQGKNCPPDLITIVNLILGIAMIPCVVNIVFDSMLIHGVRKMNPCLMCPFLIKNTVYLVMQIIGAIALLLFLCAMNFWAAIFVGHMYGAQIFMHTYFLLCVRAYYYEMKRSNEDDKSKLVENVEI